MTEMTWLYNPAERGQSAEAWAIYRELFTKGITAAYIDLNDIGWNGDRQLSLRNFAALWRTYAAAGARHLVVFGGAADGEVAREYAALVPDAVLTVRRV
ncbi:hypothetical protein [Amycolatopsis albispora]|uniref:Uncharacterized protein n=1 Tax=Amycolatopsis albispora TaxID=1804986 RepID=A0A344L2F6_9PSEU|nr:hypothetical protein [Amycolatopsis albispora]AXB42230.1 hypothetical protein A4R43_06525 [Amycolatopsis albispora]